VQPKDLGPRFRGDERRENRLGTKIEGMAEFFSYALVPIAVIAVAVVLVFGLVNMMRGGSPQTSQKLMRLRVLMQFVAIIIIMIAIWVMRG
jgi:NADH:ubiquinone oxidoreductase subunit 6 (subunit J)